MASRVAGFFESCWKFRNKILWSWDFGAVVLTGLAAWFAPTDAQVSELSGELATAALALGGTLVGVVVAALAVIVALLDDELLGLMEQDEKSGRVEGHMFPYWFVTGTGVATFLLGVGLLLAPQLGLPATPLRVLFVAVAGLLVWTALGVFNIVAALQAMGVTRAIFARSRKR